MNQTKLKNRKKKIDEKTQHIKQINTNMIFNNMER